MIRYDDASKRNPVKGVELRIDEIEIPETSRPCNATAVVDLKRSIEQIGLQSAPTVVERDGRYVLVAGRHRLEALKLLHRETVRVRVVDLDDLEARLWTISENLHRAELTASQRAEQIVEWVKLTEEKREAQGAQIAQKVGRPESGNSLAARELGISRDDVRRAQTIAALPEETKEAARDAGLDDNQSALLRAAKEQTPEAQIEVLRGIKERGRVLPPTSSPAREPWATTRLPIPITFLDIIGWIAGAADADLRRLADLAFDTIVSPDERLRHDEKVRAWLDKHERRAQA